MVVTLKCQSFFFFFPHFSKRIRKKEIFKIKCFWGRLSTKLFCVLDDIARVSLPFLQLLVLSHYRNFEVNKVSLSSGWRRQAEGDFSLLAACCSLFQLKCKRAKRMGIPGRAGGQNHWFGLCCSWSLTCLSLHKVLSHCKRQ